MTKDSNSLDSQKPLLNCEASNGGIMKRILAVYVLVFWAFSATANGEAPSSNIHLALACEGLNSQHMAFVKGNMDLKLVTPVGPIRATGKVTAIIVEGDDSLKGDNLELRSMLWKINRGFRVKFKGAAKKLGFQNLYIAQNLYGPENEIVFKDQSYKLRCMATQTEP